MTAPSRAPQDHLIPHSRSESITHLERACPTLAERCVAGITANEARLRAAVENSIGLVTALNPHIGYEAATDIAEEALASGRSVAELVLEKGLLAAERLAAPGSGRCVEDPEHDREVPQMSGSFHGAAR